jgi:hypothetical protein
VEHTLGSVDVYAVAVHDGRTARPTTVAVEILVIGRIIEGPQWLATLAFATAHASAVSGAIEEE